jgi:hypothetical protein
MNETPEQEGSGEAKPQATGKNNIVGGVVLIALGALFLARNLIPWFDFSDYWPLILLAIGAALIWSSIRGA